PFAPRGGCPLLPWSAWLEPCKAGAVKTASLLGGLSQRRVPASAQTVQRTARTGSWNALCCGIRRRAAKAGSNPGVLISPPAQLIGPNRKFAVTLSSWYREAEGEQGPMSENRKLVAILAADVVG